MNAVVTNFTGTEFRNKVAEFGRPTQLASDETQRLAWKSANRAWWEATPMRYDIFGLKAEILPIPRNSIKSALERSVPDRIARCLTNRLRMGSFLVAQMRKAS